MSVKSAIEWTEATWNPVTGCTKVSEGCDHCYAETFAERFRGVPGHPYEQGFDLKLWPERLEMPLHWKKPRLVFVNSMSDLFHDDVPEAFIARVFAVMYQAYRHTFQVLTKRPARMARLMDSQRFIDLVQVDCQALFDDPDDMYVQWEPWPPKNVWLGTSVENQKWADVRIPHLLRTSAVVRFLSCEPLLGPIDLFEYLPDWDDVHPDHPSEVKVPGVDWVIVGGESGLGHRAMKPEWAADLRDQCVTANVPFFFKQWGGRTPKAGGRELDGRTWDEMPVAQKRGDAP